MTPKVPAPILLPTLKSDSSDLGLSLYDVVLPPLGVRISEPTESGIDCMDIAVSRVSLRSFSLFVDSVFSRIVNSIVLSMVAAERRLEATLANLFVCVKGYI